MWASERMTTAKFCLRFVKVSLKRAHDIKNNKKLSIIRNTYINL